MNDNLNLWEDLNVDEIPIEIVDNLHETGDSNVMIVGEEITIELKLIE